MAKGLPGADSSALVTTQRDGKPLPEIAKALFGRFPAFWGRYFTSIFTAGDVVVYNGAKYLAKWWTRNQAPGDPYGPWQPLS